MNHTIDIQILVGPALLVFLTLGILLRPWFGRQATPYRISATSLRRKRIRMGLTGAISWAVICMAGLPPVILTRSMLMWSTAADNTAQYGLMELYGHLIFTREWWVGVLLLLIVAFIHITAPEIYKELQERLHLRNCFSFVLEAKTIVILSALHLTVLLFVDHIDHLFSEDGFFFLKYGVPVIIYVLCLIINVVGIHLALQENFRYSLVRIAVVHDGKIYLRQRNDCTDDLYEDAPVWDIAVESPFEGPLEKSDEYAMRITRKICTSNNITPRLILKYTSTPCDDDSQQRVSLYILPLNDKNDLRKIAEGRFFSFDEISETAVRRYNPALLSELDALQMAAEMWQTFGSAD